MWKWLNDTARQLVGMAQIDPFVGERDDIVQETLMYLYENQGLAQKIYDTQSKPLLYSVMKRVVFRESAKAYGMKRDAFMEYNRILEVCKQYDIELSAENAYKISGLLDDPVFTIAHIKTLIASRREKGELFRNEENELYRTQTPY